MKEVDKLNVLKCALVSVGYVLMVIWGGNYWWLLGLLVVFDVYITKVVPWDFLRKGKNGERPVKWREWLDAILFAVGALYVITLFFFQNYKIPTSSLEKSLLVGDHLFVSKLAYGPRMPNTPIYIPFLMNTIPGLNCKSYLDWPKWDYKRLAGLGKVERGDIVVFNFPAGDTVCVNVPNPDYYSILLMEGAQYVRENRNLINDELLSSAWNRNHTLQECGRRKIKNESGVLGDIVARPVDKRDCYVKRCIGLPGDTLRIIDNRVYINGEHYEDAAGVQHLYTVTTNGVSLQNEKFYEQFEFSREDVLGAMLSGNTFCFPLTAEKVERMKKMPIVTSITQEVMSPDSTGFKVFPYSQYYNWSRDNYGPVYIPKKGVTVELDENNIVLYERVITAYEGHTLDYKDGKILVDGEIAASYTFAMDYYWMMGDNRHRSADSRYWGFVPEDHIIGEPKFVFLSLDYDKGPFVPRMDRFFKTDF